MNPLLNDDYYMGLALAEARAAFAEGEIPIGAVVVAGGRVIGRGHNQTERLTDVTAHAEMLALTAATRTLRANTFRSHSVCDGGAVSDVCRSHRLEPVGAHSLRRFRCKARLFYHSASGLHAVPPPCRSVSGSSGRGMRGTDAVVFPRQAFPK